ncbi:hypothetical protein AA21291_2040 [Swaminathania salitolerans LMG 21291]|uniref:Uncharacterized protein n=1 Tax=Swaminathania salitolerans TaxID=182838 RepID=A0A511BPG6_9PROT|nr:hypothetical protein AA21291_2040 [Swaminathania salitolerans LMG 21291]GEL01972.1 hypothetical protein SSA02_11350 [Swaminathania salitolerans]
MRPLKRGREERSKTQVPSVSRPGLALTGVGDAEGRDAGDRGADAAIPDAERNIMVASPVREAVSMRDLILRSSFILQWRK